MSLPKYIINIKKNNYSIVYQAVLKVAASDVHWEQNTICDQSKKRTIKMFAVPYSGALDPLIPNI